MSESQIFRDYEEAFGAVSGLPLSLEAGGVREGGHLTGGNPFCELMARHLPTCGACLELQEKLKAEAAAEPKTLTCFAGLCETAVPVRLGDGMLAFLQTGHVFLEPPTRKAFKGVAARLMRWGANVDLKRAEEAWLAGRVLAPEKYEAFVKLLAVFAMHLGACGNWLALRPGAARGASPLMEKAKEFILAHSSENLTLGQVARVVNLSAHHFCRKFKEATGLSFTEFVTRTRVERARQLLSDRSARVSEVAFAAGFQSVSQFNRVFRQRVGMSPSDFRALVPTKKGSGGISAGVDVPM